jgi:6-phosphogluconolactonase (cycloisomerase 2 family)
VDPSNKYLYSEQPSGNGLRTFTIAGDGSLGSAAAWNLGYSPNGMIAVHPNGNFLYGTSLAGNNIYDVVILSNGSLDTLPAGSSSSLINAPKAFAIKPTGEFAYVANYGNNTINRYQIDPGTGVITSPLSGLDIIGTVTNPMAIAIHPTLDYLYAVGDNSLAIQCYSIDPGTGLLTVNGGTAATSAQGSTCLVIDPSGQHLYCVNSWYQSTIDVYKISQIDGSLSMIAGSPYYVPGSTAAGIVMEYITIDPTGKFLYGTIYDGTGTQGSVEGYSINQSTGELTYINSWTYPHYYASNPVIAVVEQ